MRMKTCASMRWIRQPTGLRYPHFLNRFSTTPNRRNFTNNGPLAAGSRIAAQFCTFLSQVFQSIFHNQLLCIQIFTNKKNFVVNPVTRRLFALAIGTVWLTQKTCFAPKVESFCFLGSKLKGLLHPQASLLSHCPKTLY